MDDNSTAAENTADDNEADANECQMKNAFTGGSSSRYVLLLLLLLLHLRTLVHAEQLQAHGPTRPA